MSALALMGTAALMGLLGTPHCAAMCSAPCTAVLRRCGPSAAAPQAFHLGRLAGYAAGGALAASSVTLLHELLAWAPWLRPLWVLLHAAALALGLWMLVKGRLPAWAGAARSAPPGWQRLHGPVRAGATGAAWIAWPCALSQSALLVAALADGPASGAAVMASFAIASSPGLVVVPLMLRRLAGAGGVALDATAWPVRLAGAALALGSAWALGHGLWQRVADWCGL